MAFVCTKNTQKKTFYIKLCYIGVMLLSIVQNMNFVQRFELKRVLLLITFHFKIRSIKYLQIIKEL